MSIASYEDANQWLDGTKLVLADQEEASSVADNADTVVQSYLGAVFPDHVLLWDFDPSGDQEASPKVVREAASLLMASYYYSQKYSGETRGESDYATELEDRAIYLLQELQEGNIVLTDTEYGAVDRDRQTLQQSDFWPNDLDVIEKVVYTDHDESVSIEYVENRKFTMDQQF